jgi:putative flippase GtrA
MRVLKESGVRFIIAGGFTAAIYFSLVLVFIHIGFTASVAALFSYALAFIFGYTTQKKFAFKSNTRHAISLSRYAILQALCALCASSLAALAEFLGVREPISIALVTTVGLGLFSYYASSKWVFSE